MKSPRAGVLAALGGCLSVGIASPLVSLLKVYRTEELLLVRGFFAALTALIILRFRPQKPNIRVLLSAVVLGGATWTYYQAMRCWGVDLTMIMLTTSPIVNFCLQFFVRKQRVRLSAKWALVGLIVGAVLALQPWNEVMNWCGFAWSLVSVILTGIGFDLLASTTGNSFNRVFWFGCVYGFGGLLLCASDGRLPFNGTDIVGREAFFLSIFAVASASIFVCNIFTFDNLRVEIASVLNASQTVAAIIGAWFLMGESLSYTQLLGAIVSFGSATWLSYKSSRVPIKKTT